MQICLFSEVTDTDTSSRIHTTLQRNGKAVLFVQNHKWKCIKMKAQYVLWTAEADSCVFGGERNLIYWGRRASWSHNSVSFRWLWAAHKRQWEKKEWQKGQDLRSHLVSNSFTFCFLQLNMDGQDVTSNPEATSQTSKALWDALSRFENKGEGQTLARWPPVSGWTPKSSRTL